MGLLTWHVKDSAWGVIVGEGGRLGLPNIVEREVEFQGGSYGHNLIF